MIWLQMVGHFFKDNARPLSYAILIGIIVILFLLFRSERNSRMEAEEGLDASIKISNGLRTYYHKYKNKHGDSVLVAKATVIPKSQVNDLLKQRDLEWLKKLEGIKRDGRNLQSAESFDVSFMGEFIKPDTIRLPCKNDTLKLSHYKVLDEWNDIDVLMTNKSKIQIKDRYYAAIEVQRPKHWFWKGLKHLNWGKQWEPIGEITNSNKHIKIDSLAVITIK